MTKKSQILDLELGIGASEISRLKVFIKYVSNFNHNKMGWFFLKTVNGHAQIKTLKDQTGFGK